MATSSKYLYNQVLPVVAASVVSGASVVTPTNMQTYKYKYVLTWSKQVLDHLLPVVAASVVSGAAVVAPTMRWTNINIDF